MKVLVIGASGLVGSSVLASAVQRGHSVTGTSRTNLLPGLSTLDCGDISAVEQLIRSTRPDAVVYSAGWTWVDGCEDDPARAHEENAHQPERVARLCHQHQIRFVYFSSSYVFDGNDGPYNESALPNPINVYACAKLDGERLIAEATSGDALIARLICVYGPEARPRNFAFQVLQAMREGKPMVLPSDQCGNPTYAGDVARWVLDLMERGQSGIWHLGGPWPTCTRPEWAEMLVSAFRGLGIEAQPGFSIAAVPTSELKQRALRPLRAGMISNRASPEALAPTPFPETIRMMLENRKVS
jgi:dTDP-4-dehydrorhamnose reductase